MDRQRALRALTGVVLTLGLGAAPLAARAATTAGSAEMNYKVLPTLKATVVPNYQTGYGPTGGAGSGSTPAAGAGATLQGGTVDFGNVVVGYAYLYKYAAQLSVQTNDAAGFVVYGEGATDLNGSSPTPTPSTFPLAQTLFWLISNSGNNAFSPATTFNRTSATPLGVNGSAGISYTGAPPSSSLIWSYNTAGNVSQGYDYELHLSSSIPQSQFNVYIVYTVIGN